MTLNHMLALLLVGIGIGITIGGIWMDWYLERKWEPKGVAEQTGTGLSTLALEPIDRAIQAEHAAAKLWRIEQALHSQNDLAGLQQFYDYVKGVLGKEPE